MRLVTQPFVGALLGKQASLPGHDGGSDGGTSQLHGCVTGHIQHPRAYRSAAQPSLVGRTASTAVHAQVATDSSRPFFRRRGVAGMMSTLCII